MSENKRFPLILAVYYVLLFTVWAIVELFVRAPIESAVSSTTLDIITECGFKTVLWFIPAFLLIRRYSGRMLVPHDEMFRLRKNWGIFAAVFAFFTVYILLGAYRLTGHIALAEDFSAVRIFTFLITGFCEEIVFRGWLFNGSARLSGQGNPDSFPWAAAIINALMFLAVHFPIWLHNGVFAANMLSGGFVSVTMLSILFSWTFFRTRSLIIPALLHWWWDLLLTSIDR